jgi:hypothetical protein
MALPTDLAVRCRCGAVRGTAREVSPRTVSRSVCYCRDCRAFARWLDRLDLLDAAGGTEIVQLGRARLEISSGVDRLRCVRLSQRGMHRWYSECCRTPLGNTIPRIPFVGLARAALDVPRDGDELLFGEPIGSDPASALGPALPGPGPRAIARVVRLMTTWALRRLGHPTPFFDRHNRPTVAPRVLTPAERDALRDPPRG